jgi:hypothetical protein
VNRALATLVSTKTQCYRRCNARVWRGTLAPGSCDPPGPTDPATAACISATETGAAAAIAKNCAGTATPACYATITSGGWAALAEAYTDYLVHFALCGSPGGAFLD